MIEGFTWTRTLVETLDLSDVLLNGVLCFMLFAGSINVKIRVLGEEKWVILTLAIGATLVGAAVVCGGRLARLGQPLFNELLDGLIAVELDFRG